MKNINILSIVSYGGMKLLGYKSMGVLYEFRSICGWKYGSRKYICLDN